MMTKLLFSPPRHSSNGLINRCNCKISSTKYWREEKKTTKKCTHGMRWLSRTDALTQKIISQLRWLRLKNTRKVLIAFQVIALIATHQTYRHNRLAFSWKNIHRWFHCSLQFVTWYSKAKRAQKNAVNECVETLSITFFFSPCLILHKNGKNKNIE